MDATSNALYLEESAVRKHLEWVKFDIKENVFNQ